MSNLLIDILNDQLTETIVKRDKALVAKDIKTATTEEHKAARLTVDIFAAINNSNIHNQKGH